MQAGPCVVCGRTNYPSSMGGPSICPQCDCGIPSEVTKLREENRRLRVELKLAKGKLLEVSDLFD